MEVAHSDPAVPPRNAVPPQLAARDLPDRQWDVLVAGAGPAGATAAAHLAKAGVRVLLLDRQAFPRDKVCGDGLIADALGALGRLGVLTDVARQARTVTTTSVYSASRHHFELDGAFLTLPRRELDAIVAARAVANGAVMGTGAVSELRPESAGVLARIDGRPAPLRARFALVATGADDRLLRRAGVRRPASPSALAVRCYVRSAARVDRLVISYDRAILPGYAWIFPLQAGVYNVGCGVFFRHGARGDVNLRTMFRRFTDTFPAARAVFTQATSVTPLKGAPLRCGLQADAAAPVPRILAVGEAIGTTFPFTGEGIGKAMETGELAAATLRQALQTGDPEPLDTFGAIVRRELDPKYVGYRAAERWLSRPSVTDFLARRAARSSVLRQALAGILNEAVDPRAVFSMSGIARSLFG